MEKVVEFTLPDETAAVRFVSRDPVLGDVGETWFRRGGHLFQLSVSAPDRELQDAWLREITMSMTFADDAPRP
jgi:protein gp37